MPMSMPPERQWAFLAACAWPQSARTAMRGLRILKPTGHTLLEARDGAEGLAVLERHDADLVITDLLMPHKEGIATMREISARRPTVKSRAISAGSELRNPVFLEGAKVMGKRRWRSHSGRGPCWMQ